MTRLEATALSKSFGGPPLFSGLSLSIESGLTAIIGRNGSGKTTLVKILASLLKPASGTVRVLRGEMELAGDERRMAVGWSGLDLAFYEDFTAPENLRFFRKAAGAPADSGDLERRLADMGLGEAARQPVGSYSTGMKQRLRLVFALLFDPAILLLDEPMAGLDAEGRSLVERVIAEKRRSGAVILSSNDPRDLEKPEQVVRLGK